MTHDMIISYTTPSHGVALMCTSCYMWVYIEHNTSVADMELIQNAHREEVVQNELDKANIQFAPGAECSE